MYFAISIVSEFVGGLPLPICYSQEINLSYLNERHLFELSVSKSINETTLRASEQ